MPREITMLRLMTPSQLTPNRFTQNRSDVTKILIAAFVAGILSTAGPAQADHMRASTLSWQPTGPTSVVFELRVWARRPSLNLRCLDPATRQVVSCSENGDGYDAPVLGDIFFVCAPEETFFVDEALRTELDYQLDSESCATSNSPVFRAVAFDPQLGQAMVEGIALDPETLEPGIHWDYGTAGTFTAAYGECCRITNADSADMGFRVATTVTLGGENTSPIARQVPTVPCPRDLDATQCTFPSFAAASDPDGDSLSLRLAAPEESGILSEGFNNGSFPMTLSPDSNSIVFDVANLINGLYPVQVIVDDGTDEVALDYLVNVFQTATDLAPPAITLSALECGSAISMQPGELLTFDVQAIETEQDSLRLHAWGLPSTAIMTPALPPGDLCPPPDGIGSCVTRNFAWTPGAEQTGDHIILFEATDPSFNHDTCAILVSVEEPAVAALSLTKSAPPQVTLGDTVPYTFRITNAGPDAATAVVVEDLFTSGFELLRLELSRLVPQRADEVGDGCVVDEPADVRSMSCSFASLGAEETLEVILTIRPVLRDGATLDAPALLSNAATVSAPENMPDGSEDAVAMVEVLPAVIDVAVEKVAAVGAIPVDTRTVFNIFVTNTDEVATVPATEVRLVDTLDPAMSVDPQLLPAGCSVTGQVVTCELGQLAVGERVQVDLMVDVNATGTLVNEVVVSAAESLLDANRSNDMDAVAVQVSDVPSVFVSVVDNPDPAVAGEQVSYRVVLDNSLSNFAATDVTVALTELPDGATDVFVRGVGVDTCDIIDGITTCTVPDIPEGTIAQVQVDAVLNLPGVARLAVETRLTNASLDTVTTFANARTVVEPDLPLLDAVAGLDNEVFFIARETSDGQGIGIQGDFAMFDDGVVPVGDAFLLNTATAGSQRFPAVAHLGDDRFAVVWLDGRTAGNAIRGRLVGRDGPLGEVFTVATVVPECTASVLATCELGRPAIAALPDGGFVVVAARDVLTGEPVPGAPPSRVLFATLFDNNANLVTTLPALRPSSPGLADARPDLAIRADGSLLAVFESKIEAGAAQVDTDVLDMAINALRTDPAIDPLGTGQVNVFEPGLAGLPSTDPREVLAPVVIDLGDGLFFTVWESRAGSSAENGAGIFGRFLPVDTLDDDTTAFTHPRPEFQVNGFVEGDQVRPSVGLLPNGFLFLAWLDLDRNAAVIQAISTSASTFPEGTLFNELSADGGAMLAGPPKVIVFPDGGSGFIFGLRARSSQILLSGGKLHLNDFVTCLPWKSFCFDPKSRSWTQPRPRGDERAPSLQKPSPQNPGFQEPAAGGLAEAPGRDMIDP